ncbi:DUF2929 family protein [Periweissella ghanensis]|uniref:DUF2929 family protein n=1 Tax=Periweissella ghanensis TaxID=467997 RepID=A0ABM8Z9N3_9LACO|nr:DUF2929 family protein [Periweissella ghanensis]MCM0601751.1 DUF2929 family protein [Periweissella ghanensis]CAH0418183.1 hypothetical protein WGH24286_00599 [Periweissella ghanensis]
MKYFMGAFWALIFGEIIGYIGHALEGGAYSPAFIAVWAIVIGLAGAIVFSKISTGANKQQ